MDLDKIMGRLEKLKRDHVKKANIKLDEDIRAEQLERETVKLNPSSNVTGNSSQFIKKMKKLF